MWFYTLYEVICVVTFLLRILHVLWLNPLMVNPEHIFLDEGISGTKEAGQRPALNALLDAIERGEINVVIVLALDRLGRKSKIVLELVEWFSEHNCQLISCNESLDTSTPTGMFVVQMFAAIAQLDHSNIVKRLTDGRNARFREDGERGGVLPFGYERTAEGIVVNADHADLVRFIFEQRSSNATLRTIASKLNERSMSPRGVRWYASAVKVILDNEETYRGTRRLSGAEWLAIL